MDKITYFEKQLIKKYSCKYKKDIDYKLREEWQQEIILTRINKIEEYLINLMNNYYKMNDENPKEYYFKKLNYIEKLMEEKFEKRKIEEFSGRKHSGIRGVYKLKPLTISLDYYITYFEKTIKNYDNIKLETFNEPAKIKCEECNKSFNPRYFKKHSCSHSKYIPSEKVKCEKCNVEYSKSHRARHLKSKKHLKN